VCTTTDQPQLEIAVRIMAVPLESARDAAQAVCTTLGVDLEDCSVKNAGRREVLTVVVDKDGGVDLDEVAKISSAISELLDSIEELEENPFVLEVTSPGIDRPLTHIRHWRRAVCRLVDVSFTGEQTNSLIRIQSVEGDQISGTDPKGNVVVFGVPEVDTAIVQIEFNREE
jgi:ribosome maturation factor RimP